MISLKLDWDRPYHYSSRAENHVLRVRLSPPPSSDRLPLHLAIALDTSTSMTDEKLVSAKAACQTVINQLRDGDHVSLASFATRVTPLIENHPGSQRAIAYDAIQRLQADGITRTDLALDWLSRTLQAADPNTARVAILITDGHPTTNQGHILDNTDPLLTQSQALARAGMVLCTVGLGNAANFNTNFLVSLSDRGGGAFLYADTPNALEPALRDRLSACQAIALNSATLTLEPATNVTIQGFCRFRPEYLPLEEARPNTLRLTALPAGEPTDVLIAVRVPPLSFGDSGGAKTILTVAATPENGSTTRQSANLNYTTSYREAQQIHSEVNNDRFGWEINVHSTELNRTHDPNRTGELLAHIQVAAVKSGRVNLAQDAAQQLADLKQSGRLDPHRTTGLLRDARNPDTPTNS